MRYKLIAIFIFMFILLMLIFILFQSRDINDIRRDLKSYKTVEIFKNTHISGNELHLFYLAPEEDNLEICTTYCLENSDCVASNYYKGDEKNKHGGQCWLFSKIDLSKLSFNVSSCDLIIKSSEKHTLDGVLKYQKDMEMK